jgi:hypothetical protein
VTLRQLKERHLATPGWPQRAMMVSVTRCALRDREDTFPDWVITMTPVPIGALQATFGPGEHAGCWPRLLAAGEPGS